MIVWSYGGGVQTAGLAVLIRAGALPRPDLTVFADTGREGTATLEYLEAVMRPYLAGCGVDVHVAPHSLAKVDLYAHNGDLLLPAFTATGKLRTYCSDEWKRAVIRRYLRSRGVESCDGWLGISFDERHRCRESDAKWHRNVYPLVERYITREACRLLVERAGLPPAPRSSCWMCPHRTDEEWRFLRDRQPADFARACELDERARAADEQGGVYLHRSRVPLREADIEPKKTAQLELFPATCGSGHCWT